MWDAEYMLERADDEIARLENEKSDLEEKIDELLDQIDELKKHGKKVTNFDRFMENIDVEDMANLIAGNSSENVCLMCVYRKQKKCGKQCLEGVTAWLKQDAEHETYCDQDCD